MSISANFPNVRPSLLLDFANSQQLDPRVTFSRSTTAPYYDGKTSVLAEQNLVKYSQDWSQSSWTFNGASSPTTTANAGTAPDGTTTATSLVFSSQYQNRVQIVGGATIGQTYTFSFYAQNVSGNTALVIEYDTGGFQSAITTTASWARYSVTWTATVASLYVGIQDRNASGFGTTLVWGAQLEQRSSVTAYNATTTSAITNYIPQLLTAPINQPRFDFNPTTGESLGLLIEQSSTNLLTYSQDFSNAAWSKVQSIITSSANIAPDGTQTASKFIGDTNNGHYIVAPGSVTASTVYTSTIYAKAGEYNWIALSVYGLLNGNAYFNIGSGVVGTKQSNITTSTISAVGNGWYRCSITYTATATNMVLALVLATADNTSLTIGNGYSGIYIWGAQLEALAFPTSYIPTTSAQVTRASDNASMTGTNFSSWYNQGQGTLYGEASTLVPSGYSLIGAAYNSAGTTNYVELDLRGGGTVASRFTVAINGTSYFSAAGSPSVNTFYKLAGSYAPPTLNFSLSGGAVGTTTLPPQPTLMDIFFIGQRYSGGLALNGWIKKIAYYPIALTGSQNQALTGS